tara:strand:+ start:1612 stop:1938 length:327 start_codon:yes stop_codon:yes gene_type:complete
MDNAKQTKAINGDGFYKWLNETIAKFSDAESYKTLRHEQGVGLVQISYRNEYDQCGNNKAILICSDDGRGSNLWTIDFDDSLINLEPSDILSFKDYKKEKSLRRKLED